ncbi:MAG: hypothetical protein ACYS26_08520 [Planctomycetota bacterium]|jgi:hypothetical protein
MNRKYLLGGALLTTLGLAGAPWIEAALEGGDDQTPVSAADFEDDFDVSFDDEFAVEEDFTDAPELASESEGEVADDELGGLLAAVEGLGANLRGGAGTSTLFAADRETTAEPGLPLEPVFDADALRERYPLSSLVLGRGRAVAQLGGELATVGSVLSDGRTRVRRITERGVELLHQGEGVWVALPPVRHVPAAAPAFQTESAAPPASAGSQPTGDPLLDL